MERIEIDFKKIYKHYQDEGGINQDIKSNDFITLDWKIYKERQYGIWKRKGFKKHRKYETFDICPYHCFKISTKFLRSLEIQPVGTAANNIIETVFKCDHASFLLRVAIGQNEKRK